MIFFLLAAFFLVTRADPFGGPGPYGNYSGTCSLRPLDAAKTQFMMCIPNKARAFEFGEYFSFAGFHSIGKPYTVTFNLLSAKYEILYHASIQSNGKRIIFDSNPAPWGNGRWQKKESYVFKGEFEGRNNFHQLSNGPDGITFELSRYDSKVEKFVFRHRVANPRAAYKYLLITKPVEMTFRGEYKSRQHANYASEDLKIAENKWNVGPAKL